MNLKNHYQKEIVPNLKEKLGYKSVMEVPKLEKITINMGVGEASKDKKILENALNDLEAISGQKPIVTKANVNLQCCFYCNLQCIFNIFVISGLILQIL